MNLIKHMFLIVLLVMVFIFSSSVLQAQDDDSLSSLFSDNEDDLDPPKPQATNGAPIPALPPTPSPAPPNAPAVTEPEVPNPVTATIKDVLASEPPEEQNENSVPTEDQPQETTLVPRVGAPPPAWQSQYTENSPGSGTYVPGEAPMPDFDASQSPWQQMDVGQFERPKNQDIARIKSNSATIPEPATKAPEAASEPSPKPAAVPPEAASTKPAESAERERLRQLFADMIPETPGTESEPSASASSLSVPLKAPEPPTASANTPELPPKTLEAPKSEPEKEVKEAQKELPFSPDNLSLSEAPKENDNNILPLKEKELDSGPAIAKAGSLLLDQEQTLKGKKLGAATILAPNQVESLPNPKNSEPKKKTEKEKPEKKATTNNDKTSPTPKKYPKTPSPLPRPNLSLVLVNETGQAKTGEDYRVVLSEMGYRILGVQQGPARSGQTVITYSPGHQGQASALARRIPGNRILVEAKESLPAEVVIYIR